MAFQDDFSALLSRSGVTLAPAESPDRDSLKAGLTKLTVFINSLDSATADAFEEMTTEFPVKALLADPKVGIAPELGRVFHAFDLSPIPFSMDALAETCRQQLALPLPPEAPKVPHVDSVEPHQFTLRAAASMVVRWSSATGADKYHFMWTDVFPVPAAASAWNQVELEAPGSLQFLFRIPGTVTGRRYTFKVQGCKVFDLGPDKCSGFSPEAAAIMPRNTPSLRAFLSLNGISPNAGLRSLGAPAINHGLRALMRV